MKIMPLESTCDIGCLWVILIVFYSWVGIFPGERTALSAADTPPHHHVVPVLISIFMNAEICFLVSVAFSLNNSFDPSARKVSIRKCGPSS